MNNPSMGKPETLEKMYTEMHQSKIMYHLIANVITFYNIDTITTVWWQTIAKKNCKIEAPSTTNL